MQKRQRHPMGTSSRSHVDGASGTVDSRELSTGHPGRHGLPVRSCGNVARLPMPSELAEHRAVHNPQHQLPTSVMYTHAQENRT
jgi:hypothetical protein